MKWVYGGGISRYRGKLWIPWKTGGFRAIMWMHGTTCGYKGEQVKIGGCRGKQVDAG